jgi:hypothetical protein
LQPDNGISCLDLFYALQYSFKTRSGRSIQDPADSELVEEKTGKGKTQYDPTDLATRQDSVKNQVATR